MKKKEVAEYLGVSERAVNRYAASGRLIVTHKRRSGGGTEGVYDRDSVERLKREMDAGEVSPRPPKVRPPIPDAALDAEVARMAKAIGSVGLDRLRRGEWSALVPTRSDDVTPGDGGNTSDRDEVSIEELRARAVLTIPEAARVTGLGRGAIEQLIASGEVGVQRWGPNGARVVSRAALERAIVEALG
jgi:hypothetical protein